MDVKVKDVQIGDVVWSVPWALRRGPDGGIYIGADDDDTVCRESGGLAAMKLTRTEAGFDADLSLVSVADISGDFAAIMPRDTSYYIPVRIVVKAGPDTSALPVVPEGQKTTGKHIDRMRQLLECLPQTRDKHHAKLYRELKRLVLEHPADWVTLLIEDQYAGRYVSVFLNGVCGYDDNPQAREVIRLMAKNKDKINRTVGMNWLIATHGWKE